MKVIKIQDFIVGKDTYSLVVSSDRYQSIKDVIKETIPRGQRIPVETEFHTLSEGDLLLEALSVRANPFAGYLKNGKWYMEVKVVVQEELRTIWVSPKDYYAADWENPLEVPSQERS